MGDKIDIFFGGVVVGIFISYMAYLYIKAFKKPSSKGE